MIATDDQSLARRRGDHKPSNERWLGLHSPSLPKIDSAMYCYSYPLFVRNNIAHSRYVATRGLPAVARATPRCYLGHYRRPAALQDLQRCIYALLEHLLRDCGASFVKLESLGQHGPMLPW